MAEQEKILQCTGDQIDEAVSKFLNGYIKPEGTLNITQNIDESDPLDISIYKWLTANIGIPDGYIKPTGNLTTSLFRRESDSGNHKLVIPGGYYIASDLSTAEWRSGKTSGSGTSGGTYNISKAAMGWIPSQAAIIVDVDVSSLSANTVIAYYSTSSTARCIYIASSSLASNSYVLKTASTKATFNDNGVTFPAISGVKYLKGSYRWLVLR